MLLEVFCTIKSFFPQKLFEYFSSCTLVRIFDFPKSCREILESWPIKTSRGSEGPKWIRVVGGKKNI